MSVTSPPDRLDHWLPPTAPPAAALALALCFVAAVAGVLAASRVADAFLYAAPAAGAVCFVIAGLLPRGARVLGIRSMRPWLFSTGMMLAVFGLMAKTEQSRQAANHAVVERLFRDAPAPFDAAGFAPPDAAAGLQAAVERDPPRMRVAQIIAVVEEAPPPPEARHRLNGRPRVYRLRTESIRAPAAPPELLAAEIRLTVRDDPRLLPEDVGMGGAGGGGTVAFPTGDGVPLYPLPGDRIEATVLLTELDPGQVAPGQFDAPLQWVLDGLHARATIDPRQWRRLPSEGGAAPFFAARRAQIGLSAALNRHLSGRAADTLRALCWGDTSDLTVEDRAAFQRTGTVHLLAISGLHVYMLLFLLFRLTTPWVAGQGGARRGWRLARLGAVGLVLWVFASLTGFQEPVVRAVGMFSLWIGAVALRRRFEPLNALCLCGLAAVFLSPQSAHRLGFQLSYLSVGLLCWWGPALSGWLRRRVLSRLDRFILPRLLEMLSQALAAGTIALFATLPLTVYAFGVAPSWAIVANLIMIPLVELLLILALPLGLLFAVTDPSWPAAALQFCADQVLAAADGLSAWIGSPADVPPPPWWALPVCWLLLLWTGAAFRRAVQPTLPLGDLGVRRRFGYPATGLTLGLAGCAVLALSGRYLPGATAGGVPPQTGWQSISGPPPVLILGRARPCVLAQPVNPAADADPHGAVTAWALSEPDRPADLETVLRRPVADWRIVAAPAAREHPVRLAPAVWWLIDTPAARRALASELPPPGGLKSVLLVSLTPDSRRSPAAPPPELAARLRAVIVLDSAWRTLSADGQAWVAFGRAQGLPVLCADAAAVWRVEPDGLGAWVDTSAGRRWWPFDAR